MHEHPPDWRRTRGIATGVLGNVAQLILHELMRLGLVCASLRAAMRTSYWEHFYLALKCTAQAKRRLNQKIASARSFAGFG
jgi:hypothetical protein